MATERIVKALRAEITELEKNGTNKGAEMVITGIIPPKDGKGPRYIVKGSDKEFLKMNSNAYLGLSMDKEVIKAEEEASLKYGVGPGAVRFISGTYDIHMKLEEKLAQFHGRKAAMIFSSAYATSLGVIYPLINSDTIVISDALNHNCIINAMRLSRPADKMIYKHNNMAELKECLEKAVGKAKRIVVVTDGIFSMRGDFAPLPELVKICNSFDDKFEEGVITVADDSHGIGAYGKTGRGTEEHTGAKVDVLIGTLGKAFCVNGGYVTGDPTIIEYLREKAPTYIYSNPITCGECGAVLKVLEIIDSPKGKERLDHISKLTKKFEDGLKALGFETIDGPHPVTPLVVRDTEKTSSIVKFLKENGILATGLNFPVVPKGDQEIRFQINGDHTEKDIEYTLEVLKKYNETH